MKLVSGQVESFNTQKVTVLNSLCLQVYLLFGSVI